MYKELFFCHIMSFISWQVVTTHNLSCFPFQIFFALVVFFEIIFKQNIVEKIRINEKASYSTMRTNKKNFCSVCFLKEKKKVFNLPLHVNSIPNSQRYRRWKKKLKIPNYFLLKPVATNFFSCILLCRSFFLFCTTKTYIFYFSSTTTYLPNCIL